MNFKIICYGCCSGYRFCTKPSGTSLFQFNKISTRKVEFIGPKQFQKLYYSLRVQNNVGNKLNIPLSKCRRFYCVKKGVTVKKTPVGSLFLGKEMRRLLSLARTEKWNITGGVLLLFISSTITMGVPFALGKVIDLIYTSEKATENLNKLTFVLCAIFILGGLCNFGRVYLMNLSGQRITKLLREKVFNSILSQEVAFFEKNKTGELINRLSADTWLVSQCVTMNISDGLRAVVMISAGVSMMCYMSMELTIVSLLLVPPVTGMAIVYGRYIRKITRKVQDSLAHSTQVAEERISNIRTVKAFGKEGKEMEVYRKEMENVLRLGSQDALAKAIFFGMTGLSGNLIVISVLYYGGVMVSGHGISVGDLSAFLLYAAYIGVSLSSLSSFYSEMNRGIAASTKLWDIIDRPPNVPIHGFSSFEEGDVEFDKVSMSYEGRDQVLDSLDLVLPLGKVTAVVGPSGSGKSTLASLLLGLYQPTSGVIRLAGQDINNYQCSDITKHIAIVSQEPVLFSGTIKENILYGAEEEVSSEELDKVLKEANVDSLVATLPQGLDTLVGEKGVLLSGGQKQRVALARALIKNPRILLLDEATSALDSVSERLVQQALERVMKGRTVLTIAHRLSTIKNADQIAVLQGGKIVEIGQYEQLMKVDEGAFKKLVEHQTFQSS